MNDDAKLLPPDIRDRPAPVSRRPVDHEPPGRWPVGTVLHGIFPAAPHGWLMCNGQSTAGYPALIEHLGAAGLATNVTPNIVDRVIVGAGSAYAIGATGGAATHALSLAEMPVHDHAGPDLGAGPQSFLVDGGTAADIALAGGNYQAAATTGPAGSGTPYDTMPPYFALTAIIRAI